MEAQEIFDKVVSGIIKQGCQSLSVNSKSCRYRGANNTKCAAGHLIPDDKYKTHWEGTNWNSVSVNFPEYAEHKQIITELQYAHDNYDYITGEMYPKPWTIENFKKRAKEIAYKNGLKWKFGGANGVKLFTFYKT